MRPLTRNRTRRHPSFFWLVMAAWLFGCAAFQFHPRTPVGQQCPTAEVQSVKVAIRDCCGRLVGYQERAPKLGEAKFVQCRCEEKKTAHDLGLPPKLQPFFLPSPDLELPGLLVESWSEHPKPVLSVTRTVAPPVRPPDIA